MSTLTEEPFPAPTAQAPASRHSATAPAPGAIHRGDCVALLRSMDAESVDLAFADPPYNIGFKYDEYHDDHADDDYLNWCSEWIAELYRVLKPTGAFWLAIGDEYAADLKVAAQKEIGFTTRNWVVWYYTFGQNCTRKFNRSHAHLFHFVKDEERHTFNATDPEIRVPSARALVYGDRRANPTGRLPDDTWILRPQDLRDDPSAFHPDDDTWYFSRVAGTFKERQGFHGCQMPEQLLGRIVRASSNPADLVLDPFAGSGTTLAVAKKLGRQWLGFELSADYVKYANERVNGVDDDEPLSGPADPVRSAPTTAKGRRLKGHPMAEKASEKGESGKAKAESSAAAVGSADLRELSRRALADAFRGACRGASVDWLLCRADLQAEFHAACEASGLFGGPKDWNRELLRLRKTGGLKGAASGASKESEKPPTQLTDDAEFAGEIAWARARGKRPGVSLDELLCDPELAAQFDRDAAKASPDASPAHCRWAALRLRKATKTLKDDAIQYEFVVTKLVQQAEGGKTKALTPRAIKALNGVPGVYVVTTANRLEPGLTAHIGEADDLGERLAKHLARPVARGANRFVAIPTEELASDAYRGALRWNLAHRLRPTLSIDVLAEGGAA